MADSERRHDYGDLGERVAAQGAVLERVELRLAEIDKRSYEHASALGAVVLQVERIQVSVEAAMRGFETRLAEHAATDAAEHAAQEAEMARELAPLKAAIYDRRAVDEDRAQRQRRLQPWHIALLSAAVTIALAAAGWLGSLLHGGTPKP